MVPVVNFINILLLPFLYVSLFGSFSAAFRQLFSSFSLVTFGFVIFGTKISYEKCVSKTLMKLTAGVNPIIKIFPLKIIKFVIKSFTMVHLPLDQIAAL